MAGRARDALTVVALCGAALTACAAITGLDGFALSSEGSGAGGRGGSGGGGGEGGPGSGGSSVTATSSSSASAGGMASTSTSSGGGAGGAALPCNNLPCAPGEVCCHIGTPEDDHCAAPGACGTDYEMACAGPGNCPDGQQCCGQWHAAIADWIQAVCRPTCSGTENPFCGGAPEACPAGWTCEPADPLGSGYGWCSAPP